MPLYASAGIPDFWLINTEKNEIEVHQTPTSDVYKTITIHRSGDKIYLKEFDVTYELDILLGI